MYVSSGLMLIGDSKLSVAMQVSVSRGDLHLLPHVSCGQHRQRISSVDNLG